MELGQRAGCIWIRRLWLGRLLGGSIQRNGLRDEGQFGIALAIGDPTALSGAWEWRLLVQK